jgi:hypothetical protein
MTSSSISIFITDLLFLTKLQKRQTPQKGFASYDIRKHKFFRVSKTFDTLQQHAIHPYELEWMISQVF